MFAGYDQDTGALLSHFTKQGYATESTWSRGQAWAVYGFTTAYRYTKDPRFLDAARRTADYFVRRLPPDRVPYWDFDVPDKATAPRDTSAAAVTASALLELSGYESDPAAKQRDIDTARDILTSLSSPTYAPRDPRVRGDAAARHPASAEGLGRQRHHVRRLLLRRGARTLREGGGLDRGIHVGLTALAVRRRIERHQRAHRWSPAPHLEQGGLVQGHQLAVLQRRTPRPPMGWTDRALIAASSDYSPPAAATACSSTGHHPALAPPTDRPPLDHSADPTRSTGDPLDIRSPGAV